MIKPIKFKRKFLNEDAAYDSFRNELQKKINGKIEMLRALSYVGQGFKPQMIEDMQYDFLNLQAYTLISYLLKLQDESDSNKPLMALKYYETSNLDKKFSPEIIKNAAWAMKNVFKFDPEVYYDPELDSNSKLVKWIKFTN